MIIKDEFVFQRSNIVHGDENILIRKCDLSLSPTEEEKRVKIINTLISFLIQSGFTTQELLHDLDDYLDISKNHPDNDDFSLESKIEEHSKDKKIFAEFVRNLSNSIELYNKGYQEEPNLKDLFRRWLIVGYMEQDDNDQK